MRVIQGIIIFFLGGIFLGMMLGGDNYYRKKSERVSISFDLVLGLGIVGGVIGAVIGYSWQESDKVENEKKIQLELLRKEKEEKKQTLGLNLIEDKNYKNGRKWVFETNWINPVTKMNNCIKTEHDLLIDKTVTKLNSVIILDHNVKEGSRVVIERNHNFSKYHIIERILKDELQIV